MNVWDKLQVNYSFLAGTGKSFNKQYKNQRLAQSRYKKFELNGPKAVYAKKPFDAKPYVVKPVNAVVVESNDPISSEYAKFVKSF